MRNTQYMGTPGIYMGNAISTTPPRPCLHRFFSDGVILFGDPAGNPLVRFGWDTQWEVYH